MRLSVLVAATPAGVIGRDGALPWRLSSDLRRFKQLTMGHTLLMGRKTYDSIGRPLPGRTSVVLTRDPAAFRAVHPAETLAAATLDEALALVRGLPPTGDELFIIGGGEVYRLVWPWVDRVYCTWVLTDLAGDATMPKFPTDEWQLVSSEEIAADAKNEYPTRFCIYDRRGTAGG